MDGYAQRLYVPRRVIGEFSHYHGNHNEEEAGVQFLTVPRFVIGIQAGDGETNTLDAAPMPVNVQPRPEFRGAPVKWLGLERADRQCAGGADQNSGRGGECVQPDPRGRGQ